MALFVETLCHTTFLQSLAAHRFRGVGKKTTMAYCGA